MFRRNPVELCFDQHFDLLNGIRYADKKRRAAPQQAPVAVFCQATKDALKANTQEAIDRGAFGAPTFFLGEEMFFGNDRFEFIEAALS